MRIGYTNKMGDEIFIEPTADDIQSIFKMLPWKKEDFLDYSLSTVSKYYKVPWIKIVTSRGDISAPYQIIHDYRKNENSIDWGKGIISSSYQFPSTLNHHKSKMIEIFEQKGLLTKGNDRCPRVANFELKNSIPHYDLQSAFYFDQVGSNLTLDYPLSSSIKERGKNCRTVREWDILQSSVIMDDLPSFANSQLANTIGVTICVTVFTKEGKKAILKRRRSSTVAVYPKMWSNPLGFALALEQDYPQNKLIDIEDLIRRDYNNEFADELGLELSDFNPPKPIAFCRDLLRGGKPQFFFEAEGLITFEELRKK